MTTAHERRRRANSLRATVPISEELSEAIDAEVAAQIDALGLDPLRAGRVVSRSSVMRRAIEKGLLALARERDSIRARE